MPSVKSIQFNSTQLVIIDKDGTKTLLASQIPSSQNSVAKVETWINTWLAQNISGYQVLVHVFSITPLSFTVGTWELGMTPQANWWQ